MLYWSQPNRVQLHILGSLLLGALHQNRVPHHRRPLPVPPGALTYYFGNVLVVGVELRRARFGVVEVGKVGFGRDDTWVRR